MPLFFKLVFGSFALGIRSSASPEIPTSNKFTRVKGAPGKFNCGDPENQLSATYDAASGIVRYDRSLDLRLDPVEIFFLQPWNEAAMTKKLKDLKFIKSESAGNFRLDAKTLKQNLTPDPYLYHASADMNCMFVFKLEDAKYPMKTSSEPPECFTSANHPRRLMSEVVDSISLKVGHFVFGTARHSVPTISTKNGYVTVSCDDGNIQYISKEDSDADPHKYAKTTILKGKRFAIKDATNRKFVKTNYIEAICQKMRGMTSTVNDLLKKNQVEVVKETVILEQANPPKRAVDKDGNIVFEYPEERLRVAVNPKTNVVRFTRGGRG